MKMVFVKWYTYCIYLIKLQFFIVMKLKTYNLNKQNYRTTRCMLMLSEFVLRLISI